MKIRLASVVKTFNTFRAVRGVSLEIGSGELVALLGPSGSGKTTILRMVAGLEFPDSGQIFFGEEDATKIPIRDRRVGFVFQNYALFPHMTVAGNIAFGMEAARGRYTRSEIDRRADDLLRLVSLPGLEARYPSQLSGGQRQRVALARALAVEPRVLLLDEPFGALDANVRRQLRRWLRAMHDELGITTLFVTHDQEEALDLADRVLVLNEGRVVQYGTPAELVDRPASAFVMNFLGEANRFDAVVRGGYAYVGEEGRIAAPGLADGPADVFVRAGQLGWTSEPPGIPGRIERVLERPAGRRLIVRTPATTEPVEVDLRGGLAEPGSAGFLRLGEARAFPKAV